MIALTFDGARSIATDTTGNLVLTTADGQLQFQKPTIYQLADGVRHEVAGNFALQESGTVRFDVSAYDVTAPLVIDPVLVYSSYLGGAGQDIGNGIAVDAAGSAYVVGDAGAATFPTVGSNQVFNGGADIFISKFNPTGSALIYSTFLGGNTGSEHGWDIAVDGSGNAYVTGVTVAADFPTTPNALQPIKLTAGGSQDTAFVTKLGPTGALAYSTYLSGTQSTRGFGIATVGGYAYVTGQAGAGFPLTASAFSSTSSGAGFLTRLNTFASGSASLSYSTFLGPTGFAEGRAIALDAEWNVYITGYTNSTSTNFTSPGAFQTTIGAGNHAFVAKFDTFLSGAASRVYSTYLGGNGQDYGGSSLVRGSKAIAVDASGYAYVTGQTSSTNFPVVNAFQQSNAGYYDGFLTKVDTTGTSLVYSTYLGGSNASVADDSPAVAVNAAGNAYVTGHTESVNFPLSSPFAGPGSTTGGLFVTKFTPSGNDVVYSVRIGRAGVSFDESGRGIALDACRQRLRHRLCQSGVSPGGRVPGSPGRQSRCLRLAHRRSHNHRLRDQRCRRPDRGCDRESDRCAVTNDDDRRRRLLYVRTIDGGSELHGIRHRTARQLRGSGGQQPPAERQARLYGACPPYGRRFRW